MCGRFDITCVCTVQCTAEPVLENESEVEWIAAQCRSGMKGLWDMGRHTAPTKQNNIQNEENYKHSEKKVKRNGKNAKQWRARLTQDKEHRKQFVPRFWAALCIFCNKVFSSFVVCPTVCVCVSVLFSSCYFWGECVCFLFTLLRFFIVRSSTSRRCMWECLCIGASFPGWPLLFGFGLCFTKIRLRTNAKRRVEMNLNRRCFGLKSQSPRHSTNRGASGCDCHETPHAFGPVYNECVAWRRIHY